MYPILGNYNAGFVYPILGIYNAGFVHPILATYNAGFVYPILGTYKAGFVYPIFGRVINKSDVTFLRLSSFIFKSFSIRVTLSETLLCSSTFNVSISRF